MPDMTIKEAIQKTMKENGWTKIAEVAVHGKSSPHTVTKILDGSDRLQLNNLKEILDVFGYEMTIVVTPKPQTETQQN